MQYPETNFRKRNRLGHKHFDATEGPLPWPVTLFGCICAAVGGLLIYGAISIIQTSRAAKQWPTAPAVITESDMTEREEWEEDEDGGGRYVTMYTPVIRYEYEVDGKTYTGRSITPMGDVSTSSKSSVDATLDKYPLRGKTQVYFNPDKHSVAYLEPSAGFLPYVLLFFGLLAAGMGAFLLYLMITRRYSFVRFF